MAPNVGREVAAVEEPYADVEPPKADADAGAVFVAVLLLLLLPPNANVVGFAADIVLDVAGAVLKLPPNGLLLAGAESPKALLLGVVLVVVLFPNSVNPEPPNMPLVLGAAVPGTLGSAVPNVFVVVKVGTVFDDPAFPKKLNLIGANAAPDVVTLASAGLVSVGAAAVGAAVFPNVKRLVLAPVAGDTEGAAATGCDVGPPILENSDPPTGADVLSASVGRSFLASPKSLKPFSGADSADFDWAT